MAPRLPSGWLALSHTASWAGSPEAGPETAMHVQVISLGNAPRRIQARSRQGWEGEEGQYGCNFRQSPQSWRDPVGSSGV